MRGVEEGVGVIVEGAARALMGVGVGVGVEGLVDGCLSGVFLSSTVGGLSTLSVLNSASSVSRSREEQKERGGARREEGGGREEK